MATSPRFADSASESSGGPWFQITIEEMRLVGTDAVFDNDASAWPIQVPERYLVDLEMCPVCHGWDTSTQRFSIDVYIEPETIHGKRVTKNTLGTCWVGNPHGVPFPIMHRKLFDAIGSDSDADWLVGDVVDNNGSTLDEFVSLLDRKPLSQYGSTTPRYRLRYTDQWARNHGSSFFGACGACGRICGDVGSSAYLLSSEISAGRGARLMGNGVCVSKSVVDRLELYSPSLWPNLRLQRIPVYDEALDPFPQPMPIWWEDFVSNECSFGNHIPFPEIMHNKTTPSGWLKRYTEQRETVGVHQNAPPKSTAERLAYYLRLRSCWEPRIAEQIHGMGDQQLVKLMRSGLRHHPMEMVESWIGIEPTASRRSRPR